MTYAQPQADPTGVVGRRIGAYALDFLLIGILSVALIYPLFSSASKTVDGDRYRCSSQSFDDNSTSVSDGEIPIDSSLCFDLGDKVHYIPDGDTSGFTSKAYGIGFGLQLANLVVLQGLVGASVGKLLLGLRVIRQDGKKAGIGWAFLRWILLFVDQFCCFLPGAILVFTTKGHRRIGDMAASTFVVRARDVGTPPQVPGVTSGYGTPGYDPRGGYGAPGGYAAPGESGGSWPAGPAAGATWGTPAASAPSAPSAPAGGAGPTWDAGRNAYIQYDREQGAWVQWNDGAQAWLPIDQ
ncbi:RDD family protein [Aquihabitans sp. G128]|uniref:RDD family protein n=1 Tax=Aquihabitans sp. G128 TaxID=2849779 RepID=UPI001C216D9B|nr:RDD family protein [Aquihabitans sp. G128]QXC62383.1 RDD family protein [Aquihabitans sp. G128]